MHTEADDLGTHARVAPILLKDVAIDGPGLQMLFQSAGPVVFYGTEEGTIKQPAVFPGDYILLNQPLRHRMHRDEADFAALTLDSEVHHALTALHVTHPGWRCNAGCLRQSAQKLLVTLARVAPHDRARDRGVIRRVLVQRNAHKTSQCQRIRQPPGNTALGPDALEISDQQRAKVNPRR